MFNRNNIYSSVSGRYIGRNYSTEDLISSDYMIQLMSDCGNLVGHDGCVNAISYHPLSSRSHLLITGSDDTTVRIWNIPNRKEIRRYAGHLSNVFATEFFAHRDVIVSGGNDADLRVYDIEKDVVTIYKDHHRKVLDIQIDEFHHPSCFFSCSADGTIRCFDIRKHYKNSSTTKIQRNLTFNEEEEDVIPQAMGGGRYRENDDDDEEEDEDEDVEDEDVENNNQNNNNDETTTTSTPTTQRRRRRRRVHPLFFGRTESLIEGRKGMSSCLLDFQEDDSFVYNFDLSPNGYQVVVSCKDGNVYLFDLRNLPSLRERDDPRVRAVNVFRNVFEDRCEITGCAFNYNGTQVVSMPLGKSIHSFDVSRDYRKEGVDYLKINKYKKTEEMMKDEEEKEEGPENLENENEAPETENSQQTSRHARQDDDDNMNDEDDEDNNSNEGEEGDREMLIPARDFLRMLLGAGGPPDDNDDEEETENRLQQQQQRRGNPSDPEQVHVIEEEQREEQNTENNQLSDESEEDDDVNDVVISMDDSENDDDDDDDDEIIRRPDRMRRRRRRMFGVEDEDEEVDPDPDCPVPRTFLKRFRGHYSQRTIKGIWYFGKKSEYIVCGSDDANIYIYDTRSGELVRILEGHDDIVNTTKPHPHLPMICASGLESVVKVWEARPPYPSQEELKKREDRIKEIRRKNVNPPSTMSSIGLLDLLQLLIQQQQQRQDE